MERGEESASIGLGRLCVTTEAILGGGKEGFLEGRCS